MCLIFLSLPDRIIEAESKELAKPSKICEFLQMLLDEMKIDTGSKILAGNLQVINCTKHFNLKDNFIGEFTADINGVKQCIVRETRTNHNVVDVNSKIHISKSKRNTIELDLDIPFLR